MLRKILVLSFSVLFSCCGNHENKNQTSSTKSDTLTSHDIQIKNVSVDTLISIIAAGDIMMGSNYPSDYSLPPDDGKHLFDSVKNILKNSDVTFGNLEGTFLNSGGTPKKCNTPENCVCFRMPEHYAQYLNEAGFDVVSLANNHSGDMGEEGRISTKKILDELNINYAGYLDCPLKIFKIKNKKIGFAAFAPNAGTVSINDLQNAAKIVSGLKKDCDIVIVSFHGGSEGFSSQRVTGKREFFLGEDRGNVHEFAHAVIDAGADVVFGQGPHVPRAVELYNDKMIAYSLGNFCTFGKFSLSGSQGIAPLIEVFLDDEGDFVKGNIFSYKQVGRGMPVPDSELNAVKIIKDLTQKDFPQTPLMISDSGYIKKINFKISKENGKEN